MATYQSTHTGAEIDEAVDAVDEKLPLTGGIVSGSLGIGVSETSTIPLDVYNTGNGWAMRAYSLYNNVRSTFYASSGTGSGLWCGTSLTASNKYVAQFRSGITNIGSGGSAVLYIRADGNVGIGNEAPSATLDVTGTMNVTGAATLGSTLDVTGNIVAGGQIRLPNNTGLYMTDASAASKNVLYISTTNNLHLGLETASAGYATYINGNTITFRYGTSRTIGMVLNTSGNVGIGTTTPTAKLHVDGDAVITGGLSLGGQAVVSVFSGSTAPSSSTGSNGDIYIQTT